MIRVGITEMHGIAQEYSKFPPPGVEYSPVETNDQLTRKIFKSAAKGVYAHARSDYHDILEAPLFPVITKQPWIYTPAHFSSAGSFDFFGLPTPRFIKMVFASQLLRRENFKKLIFKSEYGRRSLLEYGGISDSQIVEKTTVIHPVVRSVPDDKIRFNNENIRLLFVGEFLRKGGANVVDAFLQLNSEYPNLNLTICANRDFQTNNEKLKNEYLKKIDQCKNIDIRFVNRDILFSQILPESDIYLCPTYMESWGFSIQEAMAFGLPVVTTNISAIPEIIESRRSGILIDIKNHHFIKTSKGYIVDSIPQDFMTFMTEQVYKETKRLIDDFEYRKAIGLKGLSIARTKFSVEERKQKMLKIYEEALQ